MELTRSHAHRCETPDVFFDLQTAQCRACGSSCGWKTLLALAQAGKAAGSALISTPPNEPIGSLNLWWPVSVPYATSSRQNTSVDEPSISVGSLQLEGKDKETAESRTELGSSPHLSSPPGDVAPNLTRPPGNFALNSEDLFYSVEREALASNQSRLVCLSIASNTGAPVHVTLEIFPMTIVLNTKQSLTLG